jgi:O-antigen ligase
MSFDDTLGSLTRIAGIPALLLWILSLISRNRIRTPNRFLLVMFAFVAWNMATLFWSVDVAGTALEVYHYFLVFGCLVMIWDLNRTEEEGDACLLAFVLGGYLLAGQMVHNFMAGDVLKDYGDRYTGSGFNPNEPGKIFAITIPIAWYLGIIKEKQRTIVRFATAVYPLVSLFAVVLSASRGGLLACIPAIIFVLFNMRRLPLAGRIFLAVAAFGAVIMLLKADIAPLLDRFSTIASSAKDDQLSGRTEIWAAGWQVFTQNIICGVGTGAFPTALLAKTVAYQGLPAHNTFLSIATETGLIGFGLFVTLLVIVVRDILRCQRSMRVMWFTCIISLIISMASSAWEIRPHPWLLLALIITWNHAKRDIRLPQRRVVSQSVSALGGEPSSSPA